MHMIAIGRNLIQSLSHLEAQSFFFFFHWWKFFGVVYAPRLFDPIVHPMRLCNEKTQHLRSFIIIT